MDRNLKYFLSGLLALMALVARADQTIFQPTIFASGSSLTIQSGVTLKVNAGGTLDVTGATVLGLPGGISTFLGLTDTPDAYTGQGGKLVAVKSDVSGLEFITVPAGGVTSVFTRTGAVVAASGDYAAFYQPLDADLTSIAALTTTAFGRGFLPLADAAAARTYIGAGTSNFDGTFTSLTGKPTTLSGYGITDAQPLDSDLTSIAALTTTTFGRGFLPLVDATAARTYIGAGTSSFTQAQADALYSPLAHTHTFASLTSKPTTLSGYGITDAQPLDVDLTALAAIAGAQGDVIYYGAGGWTKLAAGSDGYQLTTHGVAANPSWDLPGAGGGGGGGAPIVYLQTAQAATAGTTATGYVMAGYAGTLTPVGTGKVMVTISGYCYNTTAGGGVILQIRYGTGAAPAHGAGPTGTVAGPIEWRVGAAYGASQAVPFSATAILSGLTPSTPIWIDAGYSVGGGGSGTAFINSSITAVEVPSNTVSDTALDATWNGIVDTAGSKNALHDWAVKHDSDYDGKVDVLDQVAGIPLTDASGVLQTPITNNSANWNTAFSERNQWDGGATGLTAATGRTSLGATTVGSNLFTLTNPSAITFLKVNADNTVTAESAGTFRTSIGAGTGSGTVTNFSAGDLAPLFTTTEATTNTTPALTFALTNAAAGTVFANNTTGSAAPAFVTNPRITAVANLTSNGFVKTGGGIGTLSIDTATYQPADADLDTWATKTPYAGTLTITTGKTLNVTNTLTFSGTDASTLNIGGGGTLGTAAFSAATAFQPADADLTTWAGKTPYAGDLTITAAKSLNVTNILTLSGTDGSTLNVGAGGTLGSAAYTAASAYQPAGSYEVPLTFAQSLVRATNTVTLAGDSATPGNSKYWGTNASGTKGFYDLPSGGGGVTTFLGLTDAPDSYVGAAGKVVAVNGTEDGLEFVTGGAGGTGDVTGPASSVDSEFALFSGTGGKTIKRATGSGLVTATSGVFGTTTNNSTNWDTAFSERNQWDGGATGLVPGTGRTSLGLVIGVNVQAYDADLTTWAAKTPYAGTLTITTGKTLDVTNSITLSGTDASTLNIGSGGTLGSAAYTASTAYQAADADLTAWAAKTAYAGNLTITTGKTANITNTLTFSGTDGSTLNVGAGGTLGSAAYTASGAYQPADVDLDAWAGKTAYAGNVTVTTGKTLNATNSITLSGTDASTLNIGGGGTLGSAAYTASTAYQPADAELNTWATLTPPAGAIVGTTDTQTLTNKRVTPRVTTIASSATPAINTDACDTVDITALATDITSMTSSLTGTPNNFDKLIIRIKDNGTSRAITWGAAFASSQSALPTKTVAGKVTTVGLLRDATKATWECIAVDVEDLALATLQTAASAPAGTTSAHPTQVMTGLGAVITPTASGKVFVEFSGFLNNNTAGGGVVAQIRYGTGTAPTNGAASTGTVIGTQAWRTGAGYGANQAAPFNLAALITGLTPGVAVWLDLGQSASGGGTASVNCSAAAFEIP